MLGACRTKEVRKEKAAAAAAVRTDRLLDTLIMMVVSFPKSEQINGADKFNKRRPRENVNKHPENDPLETTLENDKLMRQEHIVAQ
jgi:hypothetical protein